MNTESSSLETYTITIYLCDHPDEWFNLSPVAKSFDEAFDIAAPYIKAHLRSWTRRVICVATLGPIESQAFNVREFALQKGRLCEIGESE